MKEGRSCCASAVVGDKLFVIGGYGTESILRTVEMYDPVIDNWETRCEMFGNVFSAITFNYQVLIDSLKQKYKIHQVI